MSKISDLLSFLGLSANESKIYMSLVEYGPAIISQICRNTGMHRPTVYQTLPRLVARGLVTAAPLKKQRRYAAEPPAKLARLFEVIKSDFSDTLPTIEEIYAKQGKRPIVKFFEGKRGVTSVVEDLIMSLKRGDTYYRYSSARAEANAGKFLPEDFVLRESKQIQRLVITDKLSEYQKKNPTLNRIHKLVPADSGLFDHNIVHLIYDDKVVIADMGSVTAVLIQNPALAEFQKKIFKLLFRLL